MESINNTNQQSNPISNNKVIPPKSLNGRIMSDAAPYNDEMHTNMFKVGYKAERILSMLGRISLIIGLVFFVVMVGNNGFVMTLFATAFFFGGAYWVFSHFANLSRTSIFPHAEKTIESVHSIIYNLPYNTTISTLYEILQNSPFKAEYTIEQDSENNTIKIKTGDVSYSISTNDFNGTFTVTYDTPILLEERAVIDWEKFYNSMILDIPKISFMIQKSVSEFYADAERGTVK